MPGDPRRRRTFLVVLAVLVTALPGVSVLSTHGIVDRPSGSVFGRSEMPATTPRAMADGTSDGSPGARPAAAPVGVPVDGPIGAGAVGTGGFPYGAGYDPDNQELYIANYDDNNTTVVNATTGAHVTDIAMSSDPLGAVFVPQDREVYVILEVGRLVDVVNTSTNTVTSNISLPGDPEYEVYDPTDRALFLSLWTSFSVPLGVQEVFTSNDSVGPLVTTGFDGPWGLALDPANDTIWVENEGNDSVTVLAAATHTVVRWLSPGPQPPGDTVQGGIAYAPVGDQMFLANTGITSTVNAFGASNYTLIASGIPVGSYTYGGASMTYDPESEGVYSASYYANSVTVISALNDSPTVTTLTISGGPWVGVYDPTTGALFFLRSQSGGAAWIFGGIAVDVEETGLPFPDAWTVTLNGSPRSGTSSRLGFVEPVGRFNFTATGPLPFMANRTHGTIDVPAAPVAPVSLALRFNFTYSMQFLEQGLPPGVPWTVALSGVGGPVTTLALITVAEPNGSYPYRITTSLAGYEPTVNATGDLVVRGRGALVNVTFGMTNYSIAFTESGLPEGTGWWVNASGGSPAYETASTLTLARPNGSYEYVAEANASGFRIESGTFEVRGQNLTEPIGFVVLDFPVHFTETGLPSGSSWSVTLDGQTQHGRGEIGFSVPNGTYPFSVSSPSGYSATPAQGTVRVQGGAVTESVAFASTGWGFLSFGGPSPITGIAVLVSIGVLVAVVVLVVWRSRRRRPPRASPSPAGPPRPTEPRTDDPPDRTPRGSGDGRTPPIAQSGA
jgi:YVTN family beta-propeller protein